MKFTEIKYQRPDIEKIAKNATSLIETFDCAASAEEATKAIKEINALRNEYESQYAFVRIKHSLNSEDEFFEKENTYFDQISPKFQGITTKYYQTLMNSKFKNELIARFGEQLFNIAGCETKSFDPSVEADLAKENELSSKYNKLTSSAKIEFDGKTLNLSGLTPYKMSKDRSVRKAANEAYWSFFKENQEEFEKIYDDLVKVRHQIALKLGYNNFTELGYNRMLRSDYNADMVANYRAEVLKEVVPLAASLIERQAKRIGVAEMTYYDEALKFLSGNPTPKGEPKWIIENGKKMYEELSPETAEFYQYMLDNELMDLETKPGKFPGGYCSYIANYGHPFIFSNFNGTSGDIDVLTHEAGHAFQVFSSRDYEISEYNWPTYEAAEIHSMSMEFFTWPWMENFFKEDTDKYKFAHLSGSILFLPYGVSVDEFQHEVYANPDMTPKERNETWLRIAKKYMPWTNYGDNEFLNEGGFWMRQLHIYNSPFYYIDYTLAQICAFQFWVKMQNDYESAWKDYIALCKKGGSQSFLKLVESANLKNPFETGNLKEVVTQINEWLSNVDDSKF